MASPSSLTQGLIKGRWKVVRKIGAGAFGEIFQGKNVVTSEDVAVERIDSKKQVLKLEVAVLKKLQPCEYVVPFITCGRHGEYNYLVMDLLGENISELRRRQASGRFSIVTTCLLALQMLTSIKAVHEMGYLHRDIKPSNFAIGLGNRKSRVFMIDFGLSRRYVLPSGKVRPPRDQSGFRGTARYASINAHLAKDLARRDDLWSLLYMLVEFANGILPWRRIKDKDQVGEMKIRCNTPELVADLPKEFLLLWEHLQTLRYEDAPDYDMLSNAFRACLIAAGGSPDSQVFDWDLAGSTAAARARTLPRLQDLCMRVVSSNLDRLTKVPLGLSAPLKEQLLRVALRLNPKLPEHCVLKLLDATTQELDFTAMDQAGTGPVAPGTSSSLFLSAIARCNNLQRLSLNDTGDVKIIEMLRLQSTKQLQSVSLIAVPKLLSANKGLRPLLEANSHTLTRVQLGGESIKDAMVETVFKGCPALQTLLLPGCRKVKGTCLSLLAKGKYGVLLNTLDLSGCDLNKSGFKSLVKMCGMLRSVRLAPLVASFGINMADIIQVVNRATHLEALDIKSDSLEFDSIFMELARTPTLRRLSVSGGGITDFGVQHLLSACTQLRQLALQCGDGISDASLQQISAITSLTSLKLQFVTRANRNLVSEHALRSLLSSAADLEELWLQNSQLLTLHSFPEDGLFGGITRLNVSDCLQMDDVAIDRVAQLCPNLKHLDLGALNNLTSLALSHVALWCSSLEELSLLNCACFEDEGLHLLLSSLQLLFIHISRFPSATLKSVDLWIHRGNAQAMLTSISNANRLVALEKRKIYSNP